MSTSALSSAVSRRTALGGFLAIALTPAAFARHEPNKLAQAHGALKAIERTTGGRLGVAAREADGTVRIAYNADRPFPLCSTFKFLAVTMMLKRVDSKADRLDRMVAYGAADLLEYAPVARKHAGEGAMTVSALCAAAIEYSDNTAANLLLREMGGPPALTRFARSLDDAVTRLDRNEPTLNEAKPGDERDTTTPEAMLGDMERILLGDELKPESRMQLEAWLAGNTTGAQRLRAGLPADWQIGDKTGSGIMTSNDIAIIRPPGRKPILAAVYLTATKADAAGRDRAIADVARVIAELYR
ncbi:MAG TPA: class A beta-lactamase [Alphaproteobacteria bacterium]|nr:class A beta-lactamase [Alphaproteobacteria bacterium]